MGARKGRPRGRSRIMVADFRLPCLCLVADCSVVAPDELPGRVAAAIDGGVSMVQLRAKEMPGGLMLSLALELARAIDGRAHPTGQ